MSTVQIGRGGVQATWDLIYSSRQKILNAARQKILNAASEDTAPMWAKIRGATLTNSDTILQSLIEKGRLPGHALHNSNSVAPFRDLEAQDHGNDIELRVRLPKGGDLKAVLTVLGDCLRAYTDKHPAGEAAQEDLQHQLDRALMEAMAGNREEGGHTPDLKRAFALWLWDWKHAHPEAKDLRKGYKELRALCDRLYKREKNAHQPAPTNTRELQKYIVLTEACIKAGKSLPISA